MKPGTLLTLTVLCAIFLYAQVFILPAVPILISGDQSLYLHDGTRMLDGQVIYRDYDHFTFPGTDWLYMILFKLFGVRAWIAPAALVILGSCTAALTMLMTRGVIAGPSAYLPGLLFVSLPFASDLDATHHWFSAVFTTAAITVAIGKRSLPRLFSAGVLIGLATLFTQSACLLALGIAMFLLWERSQENQPWRVLARKEACLLLGFVASLIPCLSYFVHAVGLKQFLYWTVVFVVKYYPADWFNTWRVYLSGFPGLHRSSAFNIPAFVLVHLIVPFVYIPALVTCISRSTAVSAESRKRVTFLAVTGLFLFLSVASAPAAVRLYSVSAPALVLLIWFLYSQGRWHRWLIALWAVLLLTVVVRPVIAQRNTLRLNLPIGRTAFLSPAVYEKCQWMSPRSQRLDYFFNDPLLAFALRLRNPSRVSYLRPTDYTRPEEVEDAMQALEKFHVRFVSWPKELDDDKEAARHPEGNHLGPLRAYLEQRYHLAHTFSNGDQIWERER